MERSFATITTHDLKRILKLAKSDVELFFQKYPKYGKNYRGAEALIALGQGAALHYIDKKNGIKDFDVWFFYSKRTVSLPYRRRGKVDFGPSKFGKHPDDKEYAGRRIDILMRSDPFFSRKNGHQSLVRYLTNSNTQTAKKLSHKAMIGLWPNAVFGKILWRGNSNR